jgi:hypothetical protein
LDAQSDSFISGLCSASPKSFTGKYLCRTALNMHRHILAMSEFRPARHPQQAIQAKLNYFLGADEYDRLFAGFEVLHVDNNVLTVCVQSEHTAEVQSKYSWHVAIVAEAILKQAVHRVNVVPLEECNASRAQ